MGCSGVFLYVLHFFCIVDCDEGGSALREGSPEAGHR